MPTSLWLIPLFPLVGALVNIFFGRILGRHAHWVAVSALFGSFVAACMLFSRVASGEVINATLFRWVVAREAPDRFDVLGGLLCLAGVFVLMYAPRS